MNAPTKQVLVTGAAGGIGEAIVRTLADEGYRVIAADLHNPGGRPRHDGISYRKFDLLDPKGVQTLLADIPQGRLDGLVNAAGVGLFDRDGSVFDIAEEVWTKTLGVNLDGIRRLTSAALPLLREGSGRSIVSIASIAGTHGMDSPLDAYQVSKAGVVSLSKSIAIQLGPENIRCNTVCPGAILTPMIAGLYEGSPDRRHSMEARTPLRRIGIPQDVADAVSFLLSERASFITGTDLIVDGGWTAQIK